MTASALCYYPLTDSKNPEVCDRSMMDFFFARIQPAAATYFVMDEATDGD